MGYKRTEKTSKAEDVPEGKHRAEIVDIGEKTIQVDEYRWENVDGKRTKVKTGNKVPQTFMEWDFSILDTEKETAPHITALYSISWFTDPVTGMQSKLLRTLEKLNLVPELEGEFEPNDAIGREVEVSIIHKEGWPRVEGPIVRAFDGGKQNTFEDDANNPDL